MRTFTFACALSLVVSSAAFADMTLPAPNGAPSLYKKLFRSSDQYRLGDEWGKKPITALDLPSRSRPFQRASMAAAKVGGGTGFYLGQFNGYYMMATNHHVCPQASDCMGLVVQFPLMGLSFKVNQFFGSWSDIDLALSAVQVTGASDITKLTQVAGNFDFAHGPFTGERLVTAGFGIADNASRKLVVNEDSDCKVFSDELRFMGDPDTVNPGPYKAWSFANGCDVSHGDSGSAMVDRDSGAVVGIIWTGRIPKSPKVQSSAFLDQLIANPTDDIWNELSYAVPAIKMGEYLGALSNDPAQPQGLRTTLLRLLGK